MDPFDELAKSIQRDIVDLLEMIARESAVDDDDLDIVAILDSTYERLADLLEQYGGSNYVRYVDAHSGCDKAYPHYHEDDPFEMRGL